MQDIFLTHPARVVAFHVWRVWREQELLEIRVRVFTVGTTFHSAEKQIVKE